MKMRKIMSFVLAAALSASLVILPVHADGMKVSAPKYYHIEKEKSVGELGYNMTSIFEAPVNGVFKDIVTYDTADNYGIITGKFISAVDVAGGSGENVSLVSAVYDADNKLVDVAVNNKATADATATLNTTVTVGENQTIKTLLWKGLNSLEPIAAEDEAPVILYFYCDDPNTVNIAWYNLGGNYTVWKNGVQVASSGYGSIPSMTYLGRHTGVVYTDTTAVTGDRYVVKNNGVASDELVADFTDGAYIIMDKYVKGRNMTYLRNDNAQWYHDSVSEHKNIDGTECEQAVYKKYTNSKGEVKEKWTNFYFKVDSDYLSGVDNAIDLTVKYFDFDPEKEEPVRIKYNTTGAKDSLTNNDVVAQLTGTYTWKTATYRIPSIALVDGAVGEHYQFRMYGEAIASVAVAPVIDTTITNLRAANTYTDGVELRWTIASGTGVTGYTIKRNGTKIAEHCQQRVYYDRNLAADTAYTYTVTAETASGLGTESTVLSTRTASEEMVKVADMTLPFYNLGESGEPQMGGGSSEGEDYTVGGLTFRLCNDNRWRNSQTIARYLGEKWCRSTVSQARSTGSGWDNYVKWVSGRAASKMQFRVDNSVISADQRHVIIEFDYFDDSNQYMTADGNAITLHYLKYNDGGTPARATRTVTTTGTDTWKTATIELTDAQFTHNGNINDYNGRLFDFQIGMEIGRGGFSSTNIKIYAPAANPMPEHEISSVVNADGTALEGDISVLASGGYDKDIRFSGTEGKSAIGGSHYMYNKELTSYNGGDPSWRRWKNGFCFKIPDGFLYGSAYEKVEIEVECYLTAGSLQLESKNSSGSSVNKTVTPAFNQWTTVTYTITPSDGIVFSNGIDGADIRIYSTGCEGCIRKITIRKDIIED